MNTALARKLRKRMPPAEARLWNALRAAPFAEFHFRRQVPLGPYFADFASHVVKLVVEIDGETHGGLEAHGYDARREAFIHAQGYRLLSVANRDVMNNLEGVLTMLLQRVLPTPTRPLAGPPSPQGGGRTMGPQP